MSFTTRASTVRSGRSGGRGGVGRGIELLPEEEARKTSSPEYSAEVWTRGRGGGRTEEERTGLE